jgi:ribosomal protein L11 methylase PrmA
MARENVRGNAVNDRITCRIADLGTFGHRRQYDLVVANILADVLVTNAAKVAGLVVRGRCSGRLILSGILVPQYREVRRVYEALGLRQIRCVTDGDWRSGCFQH